MSLRLSWWILGCVLASTVGCQGDDFTPGNVVAAGGPSGTAGIGGGGAGGGSGASGASRRGAAGECARIADVLAGCGLSPAGQSVLCGDPRSAFVQCFTACLLQGDCSELSLLFCAGPHAQPSSLSNCLLGCDAIQYTCSDGTLVRGSHQCDSYPDCFDGGDEAGCSAHPDFVCPDGVAAPGGRCDGFTDCTDASDELACPVLGAPIVTVDVVTCPH